MEILRVCFVVFGCLVWLGLLCFFWFASHTFHLLMTVTCFLVTITGPKDCPHRHDQRSIGAKKLLSLDRRIESVTRGK